MTFVPLSCLVGKLTSRKLIAGMVQRVQMCLLLNLEYLSDNGFIELQARCTEISPIHSVGEKQNGSKPCCSSTYAYYNNDNWLQLEDNSRNLLL